MPRLLVFFLALPLLISLLPSVAQGQPLATLPPTAISTAPSPHPGSYPMPLAYQAQHEPKPKVAMWICFLLGPLGIHRLYLGTSGQTWLFYLVTGGGFGFLWFTDMFLLFAAEGPYSNFDNYVGNPRILMFLDKDKGKR
ncbi:MAG: TM2 domain-containing protein [Bacteroidota bacterium]